MKNDFYADGVSLPNLSAADFNHGIATGGIHATGGDIVYFAGRDLDFTITDTVTDLSSTDPTIDKGYHGNIIYAAVRDLDIDYISSYTFTGNQYGTGDDDTAADLAYIAGRDAIINANGALEYNVGAGDIAVIADRDINIWATGGIYIDGNGRNIPNGTVGTGDVAFIAGHDISIGNDADFITYEGGNGNLNIIAVEGKIDFGGDVILTTAGTGNILISANNNEGIPPAAYSYQNNDYPGDIIVHGGLDATVDRHSTSSIEITGTEANKRSMMSVDGTMTLTNNATEAAINNPAAPPGNIDVTVDNFYSSGNLNLFVEGDGNITMTVKDGGRMANAAVTGDVPEFLTNPYMYGFTPASGSLTMADGDVYIAANNDYKGISILATDNLFVGGYLSLHGQGAALDVKDWMVVMDDMENPAKTIISRLYYGGDYVFDFNRLALMGEVSVATKNYDVGLGDDFDNALVTANLIFIPKSSIVTLSTKNGTTSYTDRETDGSLYIGAPPSGVNTGIQAPLLVLGAGATLDIEDKLVMDNSGKIEMYDGSGIRFNYDTIEALGTGHFKESNLVTNNISYTFIDATTLVTEYVWNQQKHNVVLTMVEDTATDKPTDNLETIGFTGTLDTNLDQSSFFAIEKGYVGGTNDAGLVYTAEDKVAYAIKSITWKSDVDSTNALQSKAPTYELGTMAHVLDTAPEYNPLANAPQYNTLANAPQYNVPANESIANMLYLSASQREYNITLNSISAGSNLNALYMANHKAHTNALKHAAQLNRLPKSEERSGVWGSVYHDYTGVDDDYSNGSNGFNVKRWGFQGGYDRQVNDKATYGIYVDVNRPKLNNSAYGRIDGDDFQIGIYGSWKVAKKYELGLSVGGGTQSYDAWRTVDIQRSGLTPYRESLASDYDGHNFDIALEFARTYEKEKSWLRPAIGYNFQSASLGGFAERGSGATDSLAQKVDSSNLNQHFIRLGLSGGWKDAKTDINAKLFWVSRIGGDNRPESNARFVSPVSASGSTGFRVHGAEMDKNYVNFGLGLTRYLNNAKTTSLNFGYETMLGSDRSDHLFNLTMGVKF